MRLIVQLRKGEQLGLFGHQVHIKGHTRKTDHGTVHVAPHLRQVQGAGAHPAPHPPAPAPTPPPPAPTPAGPPKPINGPGPEGAFYTRADAERAVAEHGGGDPAWKVEGSRYRGGPERFYVNHRPAAKPPAPDSMEAKRIHTVREQSLVEREDGKIVAYDDPVPCQVCGKKCTTKVFHMSHGFVVGQECKGVLERVSQEAAGRREPIPHDHASRLLGANAKQLAHLAAHGVVHPMRKGASQALPLDAPRPRPEEPEYPFVGQLVYQDLAIDVETPAGGTRSGIDPDGNAWSVVIPWHYGEFRGTTACDGDAVDCFVGPDPHAPYAWVVQAKKPGTKQFDEPKVMLGFSNREEVLDAFRAAYTCPGFVMGITKWPMSALKAALRRPDLQRGRLGTRALQAVGAPMRKAVVFLDRVEPPLAGPRLVVRIGGP